MEPLSVFSLVCGVIQIVDFSTKVVQKCRELYRDGALPENEEIETMASHLTDLRTNLKLPSLRKCDELVDLAAKCSDTAQELIVEVQNLKINGTHTIRQAISKTIKTMRKKSAIDEIQRRLEKYRKLLDSRILVDLRWVRIFMIVHNDYCCSVLDHLCSRLTSSFQTHNFP